MDTPKIKDILAFANAWRRSTAYILVGVEEVKGGRSKVVGVSTHLDDARLQQLIGSKTSQPVTFSYQVLRIEDVEIGVIEIPIQERRPVFLKCGFGKLDPNRVYLRRGSSTAIAAPDEVARMGEAGVSIGRPELILQWANLDRREVLPSPCTVQSLILEPQLPVDTFKIPQPTLVHLTDWYRNDDYSSQVIDFTFWTAFLKPLGFRLRNQSKVVGKRIRFVGSVIRDPGVLFLLERLSRPHRNRMDGITASIVPLARQLQPSQDPYIRELDDRWEITVDFGDVGPSDEVWTNSPLFVGSRKSEIRLEGELRGDNIPDPIPIVLDVSIKAKLRAMLKADVEPHLDARWDP